MSKASASGRRWLGLLGGCLAAWGCGSSTPRASGPAWLSADREVQQLQLERQLRGFDVAMMEVGHRYIELYWAGQDGNWGAAAYELQKMRLAIENGLERRPKRAPSARPFLAEPLTAIEDAVAARDPERFAARFQDLTEGCNDCHAAEEVPFFEIHPPESRVSPIRRGDASREEGSRARRPPAAREPAVPPHAPAADSGAGG